MIDVEKRKKKQQPAQSTGQHCVGCANTDTAVDRLGNSRLTVDGYTAGYLTNTGLTHTHPTQQPMYTSSGSG